MSDGAHGGDAAQITTEALEEHAQLDEFFAPFAELVAVDGDLLPAVLHGGAAVQHREFRSLDRRSQVTPN